MKSRIVIVSAILAMLATAGIAQANGAGNAGDKSPDKSAIMGVWRADMDGLPYVTLTVTNETGSLSGAILFYLHRRDKGQPVTSTPGIPEPIFNPEFDGKTLTFQVSHRRAHPPRTLNDPPVSIRMTLTGRDKAGLVNESEAASTDDDAKSSGLPMVRADY